MKYKNKKKIKIKKIRIISKKQNKKTNTHF
jgi:hypothetical protein